MSITTIARSIAGVEARQRREDHDTVLALFGTTTDEERMQAQINRWDSMFQPREVLNARRA